MGSLPFFTSQSTFQPSAAENPTRPPSSHLFLGLLVCLQQLPVGIFQDAMCGFVYEKEHLGLPQQLLLGSDNPLRGGDQKPPWTSRFNPSSSPLSAEGEGSASSLLPIRSQGCGDKTEAAWRLVCALIPRPGLSLWQWPCFCSLHNWEGLLANLRAA